MSDSTSPYVRCPACNRQAYVRKDGTLGRHYAVESKHTGRYRCPNSNPRAIAPAGRKRVSVTVDVVIPAGWTKQRYRSELMRLLREHAVDAFVVDAQVHEEVTA